MWLDGYNEYKQRLLDRDVMSTVHVPGTSDLSAWPLETSRTKSEFGGRESILKIGCRLISFPGSTFP